MKPPKGNGQRKLAASHPDSQGMSSTEPSPVQRQYEPHPLALAFPPMEEQELAKLEADIKQYGLHHPIVLYQGKILDGVQRYTACQRAKVYAKTVLFDKLPEEVRKHGPVKFVISQNARRRNLTKEQIGDAIVEALKLERKEADGISPQPLREIQPPRKVGRPRDEFKTDAVKRGADVGVSKATIERSLAKDPKRPKIVKPPKRKQPKKENPSTDRFGVAG